MRLNYEDRCVLDSITVLGREVLHSEQGAYSGVRLGEAAYTTQTLAQPPTVEIAGNAVTVSGIVFGPESARINEQWRFTANGDRIVWRIDRTYAGAATLEETDCPVWTFRDLAVWTGGLLDTGGVVWTRYLDAPGATYGVHSGAVMFWNRETRDCLRIHANTPEQHKLAARFARQPDGAFAAGFSVTDVVRRPRHGLARFLRDREDVWEAFPARPGTVSVEYALQALSYDQACDRGTLRGVPGDAVRELLNTIGRYGVIDRGIVGSNGWRSGFAVTHEPWLAQIGLALGDPDYAANCAAALDEMARHAVRPDGRVLPRWHVNAGDARPGTFDPATGFYECQWGLLLDSQPSYVINVADQFDLTGDLAWLRTHQDSCRRALEFLLRRDADHDGLVEMENVSHKEGKASDWIDIVWASHENALVNAELYEALVRWAALESLLGAPEQVQRYRAAADKLKAAFNQPVAAGGFWNADKGWYVYWREPDGAIHGDNLVVPVNFGAIAYGVCDDERRCDVILNQIEERMRKENLFHWPLCFFSYAPEEMHPSQHRFPTYENGDIFLGWGELGVRAYARRQPAVALKYVRQVLARYERDGLSFQRYLRASQTGAGDDILANNCLAVVGLYRNLYGVQPRFDRLWLEPHLTPELAGTQLRYWLRGRWHRIELDVGQMRVAVGGLMIAARGPFGVQFSGNALEFFPAAERGAALAFTCPAGAAARLEIEEWPHAPHQRRVWTEEMVGRAGAVRYEIRDLPPSRFVQIRADGHVIERRPADATGRIEFAAAGPAARRRWEIVPE